LVDHLGPARRGQPSAPRRGQIGARLRRPTLSDGRRDSRPADGGQSVHPG
jgi:hypothetical protein